MYFYSSGKMGNFLGLGHDLIPYKSFSSETLHFMHIYDLNYKLPLHCIILQ